MNRGTIQVLDGAPEAANEDLHLQENVQFTVSKTAQAVRNALSGRLEINEADNGAFDALRMLNNTAKIGEKMRLETVQTAILAMANLGNAVNDENYAMAA